MPKKLTSLRVFIASPGGLSDERKAFRDALHEFNEADAVARGVLFQPVGWEETLGGIGRPQMIINEDIRAADYFILLLWNRWGSPPDVASRFSSGTEEEYHVAMECCKEKTMRQMVIFFKSVEPHQLSDPGEQLQKVLAFRKDIEQRKTHLFHSFDTTDSFQKLLRRHLARWLRDEESGSRQQPDSVTGTQVESPMIETTHDSTKEQRWEPLTHAWKLADEGRLTEAEVEFARSIVGHSKPQPLLEYGRFLRRVGRLDQANVMLEGSLKIATEQRDEPAVSDALRSLGIVLFTRGDLDGAEQMHRKALEIEERLGHLEGRARSYGNLGNILFTRGDLDGAEQMHRKALEIEERLGNLQGMAADYGNLGNVLKTRGDLDGAEQMHKKSLEIEERVGHLEGMAIDYGNLGAVLFARGDLDGAEQMHRKSLEIEERLGRLEGIARSYGNLGIVLCTRGDLDGAEQMHRKSLDIDERLGNLQGMAADYGNLGTVLKTRGDLDGAEQMHRKSLEIEERLGHLQGMAVDYGNLGNILETRGDLDGAEQMYRKALEIEERLGGLENIADVYDGLGNVLEARGDLGGAEQMYRKQLEAAERSGSVTLIERARLSIAACHEQPDRSLPAETSAGLPAETGDTDKTSE